MRLVYEGTQREVRVGDQVRLDERTWKVIGVGEPHKPASTGRVYLRSEGYEQGFFPSVIGAVWIEREDQS